MERNVRLHALEKLFLEASGALQGKELAEHFGVSRQAIVQDVALLRSRGMPLEATPRGYFLRKEKPQRRRLFALSHSREEIAEELLAIVSRGGRVLDVLVEHPLYGEIRGNIDVGSREDVLRFVGLLKTGGAEPLLVLSGGVHLHTVEGESEEALDAIERALKEKGYLLV
jgi:transcriptional regulator of NAD metabolism